MAEPATLCERLEAMQQALRRGQDALFELTYLDGELSDNPTVRLTVELAGAAADTVHPARSLLGALMGLFGCGR